MTWGLLIGVVVIGCGLWALETYLEAKDAEEQERLREQARREAMERARDAAKRASAPKPRITRLKKND